MLSSLTATGSFAKDMLNYESGEMVTTRKEHDAHALWRITACWPFTIYLGLIQKCLDAMYYVADSVMFPSSKEKIDGSGQTTFSAVE